jgi:hypothetical protein
VAAAAAVATLLGWGTASALSGPEPVPDSYGGRFVLTYAGQNTEVFNVSGCDLAPTGTGTGTAIVKPCRFEVAANAAPELKQKIVGALGSGTPPASNTYTLTHYEPTPGDPTQALSDYAARGQFTISQVTLPVLDPLGASAATEMLGVELTPTSGADVQPVPAVGLPTLPALVRQFQVGTDLSCGAIVPVVPSPVQLGGFAKTPLRSLAVSVDTSGQPAVKTGSVRISQGDSAELKSARDWLATSPPPGQAPSAAQVRMLTLNLASYDCSTGTYSNQLTISLPVAATSMDPFARTDRYFTLGLASALRPGAAPNTTWR